MITLAESMALVSMQEDILQLRALEINHEGMIERLTKERNAALAHLARIREIMGSGVEDEGLGPGAGSSQEKYIQQELRKIHTIKEELK